MTALGVGLDTPIVTYDITDGKWAARGAYLLKYFGHTNVRILDGGKAAWKHQFRHDDTMIVKGDQPAATDTNFDFQIVPDLVTSFNQIQEQFNSKKLSQILDARPKEAFDGGNIPGSINLPMSSLKDEDGFIRDKKEVLVIFKKAGVNLSEPLIFTCNSGVMASYLLAAAESADCTGAISVYDGAWSEYSKKAPNAMN